MSPTLSLHAADSRASLSSPPGGRGLPAAARAGLRSAFDARSGHSLSSIVSHSTVGAPARFTDALMLTPATWQRLAFVCLLVAQKVVSSSVLAGA